MISLPTSILLVILSLSALAHEHHSGCGQHLANHVNEVANRQEGEFHPHERLLQSVAPASAPYPKTRFYPYWDTFTAGTSEWRAYIKDELMPPVLNILSGALRSKYPMMNKMVLTTSQLCGYPTPSILSGPGVETDVFVMMNAKADTSGGWVASASSCMVSSGVKRPLVIALLLNTEALYTSTFDNNPITHEYNMYVIMHELLHGLGFSIGAHNNFVDSLGLPLKGHITKEVVGGVNRTIVNTAPLTQRLRNFYGCSTLKGGYMEDLTSAAGSHWERRYFLFDLMSSGAIGSRRLSEFTLAYMEGTGWYDPDYTYAEPFHFGQGQGCSFLTDKCDAQNPKYDEYCKGNGRGCSQTGRAGGYCKNETCSEGCRYVVPQPDLDCEGTAGAFKTNFGSSQTYGRGTGSRCFTGNLSNYEANLPRDTLCLTFTCSGTGLSTKLDVKFGTQTLTCTKEGPISVPGKFGHLDCPDPMQFCNTIGKKYCQRGCSGRGKCVDGVCQCNSGFRGIDCGFRT